MNGVEPRPSPQVVEKHDREIGAALEEVLSQFQVLPAADGIPQQRGFPFALGERLPVDVERGIEQHSRRLDAVRGAQAALLDVDTAAQVKQIRALVAPVLEKIGVLLQRRLYGPPVQVLDQRQQLGLGDRFLVLNIHTTGVSPEPPLCLNSPW